MVNTTGKLITARQFSKLGVVSFDLMISGNGKLYRLNGVIAGGSDDLLDHVFAVINALPLEVGPSLAYKLAFCVNVQCLDRSISVLILHNVGSAIGGDSRQLFVQGKSCAGQRFVILIDLIGNNFIGENNVLVRFGLTLAIAIRVVGEYQISFVRVAGRTKDSIRIQTGGIFDRDCGAVGCTERLHIINRNSQLFICRIPIAGVFTSVQSFITDLDGGDISISQVIHGIDKLHIVGVEVAHIAQSSSQLVRNNIADIVVGRILPVSSSASGIVFVFDLLLKGGDISFYLRGNSFRAAHQQKGQVRSIVFAFHGGNVFDQIIASRRKSNAASTFGFVSGQVTVSNKSRKLSGVFRIKFC